MHARVRSSLSKIEYRAPGKGCWLREFRGIKSNSSRSRTCRPRDRRAGMRFGRAPDHRVHGRRQNPRRQGITTASAGMVMQFEYHIPFPIRPGRIERANTCMEENRDLVSATALAASEAGACSLHRSLPTVHGWRRGNAQETGGTAPVRHGGTSEPQGSSMPRMLVISHACVGGWTCAHNDPGAADARGCPRWTPAPGAERESSRTEFAGRAPIFLVV